MEFSHEGDPRYWSAGTAATGRGAEIIELAPAECPDGHPLRPPNVQVFYGIAPDGARRRGYRCWTCEDVTWAHE